MLDLLLCLIDRGVLRAMTEESQSVLYIGYSVIFLLAMLYVIGTYFPGLVSIESEVEVSQKEKYRKAIVLENLLSLSADTEELYGYEYTNRRGVMPVEYFANKGPGDDELGFKTTGNQVDHCYMPGVAGLDGENFAFRIKTLADESKGPDGGDLGARNEDYKSVTYVGGEESPCTEIDPQIAQIGVVSTAMLVREDKNNTMLPVRLYVYDRASYTYIPDVGAP